MTMDTKEAPIVERQRKQTNFFESFMHLYKSDVGIGLFAMGYAYKNGGLYVSIAFTVFLGLLYLHCQHLLISSTEKVSLQHYEEEKPIEYAEAFALCFLYGPPKVAHLSKAMGILCDVVIVITQLGVCCVYLTVIAANVQHILKIYDIFIDIRLLLMIIWVPIWMASLITNLKMLAPVSSFANICITISFIVAICYAVKDGLPDISERNLYTTPYQLMPSIGTIIFAFEAIGVVIPVKNSMKNPKDFQKPFGVLNLVMSVVITMYATCGFLTYLKWGEEVGDSITLNIGQGILAQCTNALLALAISFTYPLQFFVPCSALAPTIIRKFNCEERPLLCELIFRTVVSALTLLIALAFPNIGLFISLIGGCTSTTLAMVFPVVMECLTMPNTKSKKLKYLILIKNCIILMIAALSFTFGTFVNVSEVVNYFQGNRLKFY